MTKQNGKHKEMQKRIYQAIKKYGGAVEKVKPLGNLPTQRYAFWKDYDPQDDWKGQLDIYLHEPYKIAIEICGVADVYAKVLQKVWIIKKLLPEIPQIDIFEYDFFRQTKRIWQTV